MTLTEVIGTFKTKLNPSKISNSLEKTASISDELENDSTDLNNNPYSNFGNDSVTSSNSIRTTQKTDQTLIKLTDVWKIYQMGEVEFAALKGINLEIYEGEFLVVLGPSGSGKSTLMNLLGCLDLPSKGRISLNSKDISTLDESELAVIRGQMI
jgi:putative ABC transport system ATP-binding protein